MIMSWMRLKPGNYLSSGTEIVFVALGRRILGGKPGFFQIHTHELGLSLPGHERDKAALLLSPTKQHT